MTQNILHGKLKYDQLLVTVVDTRLELSLESVPWVFIEILQYDQSIGLFDSSKNTSQTYICAVICSRILQAFIVRIILQTNYLMQLQIISESKSEMIGRHCFRVIVTEFFSLFLQKKNESTVCGERKERNSGWFNHDSTAGSGIMTWLWICHVERRIPESQIRSDNPFYLKWFMSDNDSNHHNSPENGESKHRHDIVILVLFVGLRYPSIAHRLRTHSKPDTVWVGKVEMGIIFLSGFHQTFPRYFERFEL